MKDRFFRIVERLREAPDCVQQKRGLTVTEMGVWHGTCLEAADHIEALKAENDLLREFLERGGIDSSALLASEDDGTWEDQNELLKAENERLQVQLAGCGVAALGHGEDVEKGDYGWSQSYQDVLDLRTYFERGIKDDAERAGIDTRGLIGMAIVHTMVEEIERLRAALEDVKRECEFCEPIARKALGDDSE